MKYRKMGSLDWEVSALGFGAMRLPMLKEGDTEKVDVQEAIRIIRYGIDNGINYVDTAWPYHGGESEKIVGQALKDGYREKVKLVSKLPMWEVNKAEDFDIFLSKQLEKLQTDHLDIYLFHGLTKNRFKKLKNLNLIEKMEQAREKGLIHHIGFSFHDTREVFKEIIDFYHWDMAQIQHNYIDIEYQASIEGLQYAANKGIAVVIMEPIKGGKLANPTPGVTEILEKSAIKRSPVDWALQFLWNKKEVSVVLSGMGSYQMVKENVKSASNSGIGLLTPSEKETLKQLAVAFRKVLKIPCTTCGYCLPCPNGVNIPGSLGYINELAWGRKRKELETWYNFMAKTEEELKERPNEGNASFCIKCGECLEKCPQSIDIPTELEKINEIFGNGKTFEEFY
ncbi:aldo/keto reductase [Promethearchaeum syntrophicum]|uniref:Aldo/keto reductase n=1 Tax=Promethearchaeum syntrophicum TaxID=2594042 RepID=A0A5B9DDF6_9ARCH|nr:aldo/keto reductase [Candidatus Prometheoarchaeum syntrophicum]QEE16907.1 putative oxidoreductase [Candidatus Prometheoarchaeum syntrophicum]